MNFALEAAWCLWALAVSSLKLVRPDLSGIKSLPVLVQVLCPGSSQTSPPPALGPGMVIQEGLSGKHGLLLGPYTFNLPKSGLQKETISLNSKGLSLSMYSPLLAPALAWVCGDLGQRSSSSHTEILEGLNPAHCADMWILVAPQGKAWGREGNKPGDAGLPLPAAIPTESVYQTMASGRSCLRPLLRSVKGRICNCKYSHIRIFSSFFCD